jgi:hypothetical protein
MIPLLAIFNQDASSLPKNNYQSGETTTFLTPFSGEKRHSLSPLPLRCYSQSPDNQIVLQGGNGDKGFKITCREWWVLKAPHSCPIILSFERNVVPLWWITENRPRFSTHDFH